MKRRWECTKRGTWPESADTPALACWPDEPIVLYGLSRWASKAILRAIAIGQAFPDGIIVECPFDRLLSTIENRLFTGPWVCPSFPMARTPWCSGEACSRG